jgi:hypothetical protein
VVEHEEAEHCLAVLIEDEESSRVDRLDVAERLSIELVLTSQRAAGAEAVLKAVAIHVERRDFAVALLDRLGARSLGKRREEPRLQLPVSRK